MNTLRVDENPFDLTKASDFSDSQILEYWVDLAGEHGGLLGILKPKMLMPMMLLGGKGSGKTHLMRYCSARVQAMRANGGLSETVEKDGYLGIYVRADGLNVGRFSGKGQEEELWSSVFCLYFESWLATQLLDTVSGYFATPNSKEREVIKRIASLFDVPLPSEVINISTFIAYVSQIRRQIDITVNNCALTKKLDVTITFSPGTLVFGIPEILSDLVPQFKSTIFVYLIDEVENFTECQQRFLNTLIRYRRGNTTIKIGARLYGIKTFATLGSGEPIKQNSEYERVELDALLRDNERGYKGLAEELVTKRLKQSRLITEHKLPQDLQLCFQSLDPANHYSSATLNLVASSDKKEKDRPYFEKLRRNLEKIGHTLSEKIVDDIITNLQLSEYPLLEKLNVFLLYKDWSTGKPLLEASKQIAVEAKSFLSEGKDERSRYFQNYDHFKSDLLAQLYRDCERKVIYAGLDTLIHLSQGVPRNLIGILKHIYRRSLFLGEKPFVSGTISIQAQTEGILDSAAWFWDDAQPDRFGSEVREAIDSLATLIRTIRYSEKPAECDLCTFSVDFDGITENSKLTLEKAENWSYLLRIRGGSKNKNHQQVDEKFQISPMLAPKWGLSEHRRGTLEIQADLFDSIFDKTQKGNFRALVQKRVASMLAPGFGTKSLGNQPKLL